MGKRLALQFGTEFSTLPDEIIGNKEIEAIYICTPAHTHVDLMEAALAKDKYVFCEKPIDEDLEKAKRFVYANSARAAKIMIGFHRRFDPTHLHLRETIHSGSIGQIEQIVINSRDPTMESYDVLTFTGGIFRDMTLHDIDQASVLLGRATFTGVFARTACLVDPAFAQRDDFDNAVATFWTETGVTCTILNSRRSASGFEQNIEVFCSKGSASLNTPTGMTFTVQIREAQTVPPRSVISLRDTTLPMKWSARPSWKPFSMEKNFRYPPGRSKCFKAGRRSGSVGASRSTHSD